MIKTQDRREFFTHEKNLIQLVEFSKTFGAEISVVKVLEEEVPILDLRDLVPQFCDQTCKPEKSSYEIVEVKLQGVKCKRQKMLKTASRIKNHITDELLSGNIVSLRGLKRKFARHKLTDACLCQHLARAREELVEQGHSIEKVGGGKYQLK
jgi:hypothetical protein